MSSARNLSLTSAEYLQERLSPNPGEPAYLHLSDLLIALSALIPREIDRVLDFGCGGSPYRPLFGACTYHRADLASSGPDLDFEYGLDSRLPALSEDYDCVFSSQVLEHVQSPAVYLEECYRVLKPGGRLILSTHGTFEDHACPYDYWRWTVYGLRKLVEEAGFIVEEVKKLTTGPRAAVFIAERERDRLEFNRVDLWSRVGFYSRLLDYGARLFRLQTTSSPWRIHRACDVNLSQHRVVDAGQLGHGIYIAIALAAQKV
jgi:SAM-dependent methyltransferase